MPHYEPRFPFDGYDEHESAEYEKMMEFIIRIESFQAKGLGEWMLKYFLGPNNEELFKQRAAHDARLNLEPNMTALTCTDDFSTQAVYLPMLHRVIDLGCGPGVYLLPYKEAGCEVLGLDACPTGGELLAEGEFERFDLRYPYKPETRADLCINFEVAEHLEEHWADRLVDSICDCADLVLFTAAVPGQGGSFHHNEQPHEYWLQKFSERHGYITHPLQDSMWAFLEQWRPEEARLEVCGWLLNNSFLLYKAK